MSEPRDEFERRLAQRYAEYVEDGAAEMDVRKVTAPGTADETIRAGWLRMAILGTAEASLAATDLKAAFDVLPKITGPVTIATPSPHASAAPTVVEQPTPGAAPRGRTAADPVGCSRK